ncbi:hypothetical protein MMC07_007756 [Pseudocyphellaria aurata]|nr:hypothetical protein [Pseudocyphellaria aurata]
MPELSLPLTLRGIQSGFPNDWFPPPLQTPLDDTKSDDSPTLYDGFDLEGIDQDDLIHWSKAAPEGQRLEDVKSYEKWESPKGASSNKNVLKQLNHFIRKHEFFSRLSLMRFTTSDRRRFERDVYDFGRSLGLPKKQAKNQLRKARAFCGEEQYDSDNSAWGDEVDDSLAILGKLSNLVMSTAETVEWVPQVEVKMESVSSSREQTASSVSNISLKAKKMAQTKSSFDTENITSSSQTALPERSSAKTAWPEIDTSRKRKSVGTDMSVNEHMEKKSRGSGTMGTGTCYENATQAVQPMDVNEDQSRQKKRSRKKKKRSVRSSNAQAESVDSGRVDAEGNRQANPAEVAQLLEDHSDEANGVDSGGEAVRREHKSILCQRSKPGSIKNKGSRDEGFHSPMI